MGNCKSSRRLTRSLLCSVAILSAVSSPSIAQETQTGQEAGTIRILSFNTYREYFNSSIGADASAVSDFLTKGNYDIIALQELCVSDSDCAYMNDIPTVLAGAGKGTYWGSRSGEDGVLSRLPGTPGEFVFGNYFSGQVAHFTTNARKRLPATTFVSAHFDWRDEPETYRINEATTLNTWVKDQANPIVMMGDFNAGDVSERGLHTAQQQAYLFARTIVDRNSSSLWRDMAAQYTPKGREEEFKAYVQGMQTIDGNGDPRFRNVIQAYFDANRDEYPNLTSISDMGWRQWEEIIAKDMASKGLTFEDETYPIASNEPKTMNVLKKQFMVLNSASTREGYVPHTQGDGSTTWPMTEKKNTATGWDRSAIDHFMASRPYGKWWTVVDDPNDPYLGVPGETTAVDNDGTTPISDHGVVGHELKWIGPKVEKIGDDGQVKLTVDATTGSTGTTGEFQLSRNNGRTDVYLGQLSDATGQSIYRRPQEVSQDRLAFLLANAAYDLHDTALYHQELATYVPEALKDVYESRIATLLDPSGPGYYRTVLQEYFDAHRDEFPRIGKVNDMSWEQWGKILLAHVSDDLTFQTILIGDTWQELWSALKLDDPAVRAQLSRQTGLDFENDPNAPLKILLDCSNSQHLGLQGAPDMCVDDHERFEEIVVADGRTVAIDEGAALGAADGTVILNNGGIRTAGLEDQWANWTSPVTQIDKAIGLDGLGWIDVSHPTVPVAMVKSISGQGILEKRGPGTLDLMAGNSYTGGTLVSAGTLRAGIAGALPDKTDYAINGGTLDLGGFDLTMSSLSGEGGTLGVGAGSLTVDQTFNTAYAGGVSGNGLIAKTGAGILLLTGDSSGFSGMTNISAGALMIDGDLGGTIDVTGGALGGTGTIGTTTIAAGGTLAPGGSIGTLTVAGDLTFEKGSTYNVEVNPEGADSDLLHVISMANLKGGSVAHIGANGSYDLRSTYTILSAGTLNGSFDGVTSSFAFLTPSLLYDYDLGTVDLELTRNDHSFASEAQTRNQMATAMGIESIGIAAGHEVYDAAALLPDNSDLIRASFDQLSGEIHASAKTALIEDSRIIRDAASDRIRDAFGGVGASMAPVLAYGPDGPELSAPDNAQGLAVWGHGFGSWGSLDGNSNVASLDTSTGGFLAGIDTSAFDTWRVGLLAGYSQTSFDAGDRASSGSSDNYHLGLYGGSQWGALGFRSGLAYSWHKVDTSRSVFFPGFADSLSGGYDAGTFQAFGEFGYRIDTPAVAFEPFANLAYVNLRTDGFAEGGGSAALNASSRTTDTTFTTLGMRASTDFGVAGMQVKAQGMLGWRHAFGDTTPLSTQAFAGSNAFTVAGAPITKDAAVIEAGLDLNLTDTATLGLAYQGQFGSGVQQNGFNAKLQVKF